MGKNWPQKAIGLLSAALVLFLSASAFVLSYDSLRWLADASGVQGWLSWLWPLTLDAFMIAASLAVLRNSVARERTWYQWALVGMFTLASIGFNVIHAGYSTMRDYAHSMISYAVYALPPLVVFLAFELLVSQIRTAVARSDAMTKLREQLSSLAAEVERLLGAVKSSVAREAKLAADLLERDKLIKGLQAENERLQASQRVAAAREATHVMLRQTWEQHKDWNQAQLAQAIGVAESTVMRNLEKAGLTRNGDGLLHIVQ